MHLHIDPFSGISGDMMLGALMDLGVDPATLEADLRTLPIGPFRLRAERVKRQGVAGVQAHVEVQEDPHAHRHLHHLLAWLDAAGLPARAARRARRAFERLAEAEARVHGTTVERIHFHEVGQKDAVLDIAGSMLALERLDVATVSLGPIAVGRGTIVCAHGTMPVPTPATAELLRGLPWVPGEAEGELATPTGVAIAAALMEERGPAAAAEAGSAPPGFVAERIGYGAGTRILEGRPNMLRVWLGRIGPPAALPVETHPVAVLETELDDMTPQTAGFLMERLFEEGALDVQFSPVQMKKNRPGLHIRVLADPPRQPALAQVLLRETPTLGVRRHTLDRWCLARRSETISTALGPVRVKVALWGDRVLKAAPEYESCRDMARTLGRPLAEVIDAARTAIYERYGAAADSTSAPASPPDAGP